MNYEYLEDEATADLAVVARGKTLKEAFQAAADAVINAIVETKTVEEQEIKLVSKKAKDLKSLLYDFLEEIIYFHDAEGIVFKTVAIEELDEKNYSLKAVLKGESFDKIKHEAKNEVKAITYFGMQIEKTNSECRIKFTLDL